ncbi:hypothetical protein BY996DRAFT_6471975 [Phakopsora pachyrhizi]|nr:hypothetical protein BY996DRAFT_6471975 [Phakopsora pachyrhizi]
MEVYGGLSGALRGRRRRGVSGASRGAISVHLDSTTSLERRERPGRRGEKGRAPVQEAGGLCALRWYNSTKEERRVSKVYQGVWKWSGLAGPSGREATIRKVVKIPKEEELMFDGKEFHQFLDLFEMAAKNEGVGDYNKVKQVVFFCKGRDLKEEVLVKEMKARWGRYRTAPRYTILELWTAVDGWEKKGGVSSKGDYEEFSYFFDTRLKYLVKEGTFRNEDEACSLLWRALSKELQEMAKFRLIKGKKMVENRSGGYSLPTLKELKFKGIVSVEGSVYLTPNKIVREELNKKRDRFRGKDSEESKKEEEKKKEPEAVVYLAKKLDKMTDILKSFIGQEESLKKAGKRREVYEARGSGSFVCYYCGIQGHTYTKCPRVEEDIKNGLVRREMTAEGRPAYNLPDNTRLHFDRTRTFRSVVVVHSSKHDQTADITLKHIAS